MEKIYTGRKLDEFEEGEIFDSPARTITDAHIVAFSGLTGDFNPLHTDDVFCSKLPQGKRIAHGMLTLSLSLGLLNRYVEGTCIAFLGLEINFTKMVFPGDTIHIHVTVKSKRPTSKPGKGVVVFTVQTVNQTGETVLEGDFTLLVEA